jgi:hypothetical protein
MAVMKASDGGEEHRTLKTDPCTVFVRNLPFNLNDEQVRVAVWRAARPSPPPPPSGFAGGWVRRERKRPGSDARSVA